MDLVADFFKDKFVGDALRELLLSWFLGGEGGEVGVGRCKDDVYQIDNRHHVLFLKAA